MASASRTELRRHRNLRAPPSPPTIPLMTPSNPPEEITAVAPVATPGTGLDAASPAAVVVEDGEPGGAMTFFEHLTELRKRIINSLIALAAGGMIGVSPFHY